MSDHATDALPQGDTWLALLDRVLIAAGGTDSVADCLGEILDITLAGLQLDAGAFILLDENRLAPAIACARGLPADSAETQAGFGVDAQPYESVRRGESVFRSREAGDDVVDGFECSAAVPLDAGDAVLGALIVFGQSIGDSDLSRRTVLPAVGRAVGQLIRRLHADGEVRRLNECLTAMLAEHTPGTGSGVRRADAEAEERRSTTELSALLEASRAIAASIDYDEVLRRVAKAAGEALGSPECVIWEYSPDGDLALFCCLWERDPAPGNAASLSGASYEITTHSGGLDALRAGVVVQESRSDPDLPPPDRASMDSWSEKTWLTVPLVFGSRLLGVMILIETEHERRFTPGEIQMAGAIGEQAAVALNNALRHRREGERNRWLRSLVAAGRAVSAARDPDTALGEVARLAAEAVQSPAAFIYEYLRERDELVTRARHATRAIRRDDAVGASFPVGNTPEDRRALDAGEVFVETISDDHLPAEVRRFMEAFGERTLLNVPLRFRGEALGMLVLIEHDRERVFTAEEQGFMAAFGEQVTLALTTARLATTDGLTGLANHRAFYDRLGQELARAHRYGSPVSLLMLDIDDFKMLNDTHGHPAGDEVLRELGRLVSGGLRQGVDLAARYGGEEFAVVLPSTPVTPQGDPRDDDQGARPDGGAPAPGHREGAEALAERLRTLVAEAPFTIDEETGPAHITVSIGIASYPDMAGNMDDLVARADAALYAAKRAGKNRAEVYLRRGAQPALKGDAPADETR